jgi:protein-L-isoaspartate(D-aspartate) O-methyltransferase
MTSKLFSSRVEMVQNQLVMRGINNKKVLDAFLKVPREEFIPFKNVSLSYFDEPVEIGMDQTISQPYIVALMVSELEPEKNLKCLEIGTGSGYQTAILLETGLNVYSVERHKELSLSARKILTKLKYSNYELFIGDGSSGLPEYAPFNRIIVSAASPDYPKSLIEQLDDNGIMIIPVGDKFLQKLVKITKKENKITEDFLCNVRFVPLIGNEGW